MAISLKNALLDGQLSFERGVDTYQAPVRVPRNQCCLLINNTTRQDFIGPRPGMRQIPLKFVKFEDGKYVTDTEVKDGFQKGYFQSFTGYVPDSGPSHLVFSISGKLFRVNALTDGTVQEVAVPNPRPTNRQQVWFQQAEIFLVCQDGQSKPLIYTGGDARESDVDGTGGTDPDGKPLNEVPVGTCMAYSGGRLWVALPDGRVFVAGDGVYGPTGTAEFQQRDSVLKFTENNYLSEFPGFAVPANMGPIRAMVALANLDTSLGQGPLQVFTPSGAFSIQAPFDRTLWATVTDPIKTVSLFDQGALSPVGVTLVNGDAWYRSLDGIRSFFIARRDFGTWGNRSMSYEVIKHLKDDDWTLLNHCSMALFDNRLITTCYPQNDSDHGIYHKGTVVLDFIPLTSMAGTEPPCWDGLWIGHDILQIQTIESEGVNYCYAAVLAPEDNDGNRNIELWELTRNLGRDVDESGTTERIARVNETPQLDFQNKLEQKSLEACEIWVDKVHGQVDFTLLYRPDQYPCWFPWKHWQICAKTERCASEITDGCLTGLNLREQYRSRMSGQRPPDFVVPFTNVPSNVGYTFQGRLEVQGDCEITAIRFVANRIVEPMFGNEEPDQAVCEEVICCPPSDVPPVPGGGGGGGGGGDSPNNIGACCINGVCSVTTRALCASGGGTFLGKDTTCLEDSCSATPPQPPTPEWPTPDPYTCEGRAEWGPIEVKDQSTGLSAFVGITPGGLDPNAYLAALGAPGCLEAWCAEVWSQFLASSTPFSQARLIWEFVNLTGKNYVGWQVFPNQPGGYISMIGLELSIVVEYCPM